MRFLRSFTAFILVLVGACVTLFSGAVAFGWGHKTLSVAATAVALIGYAVVFAGYWLVRDADWGSLASGFMKGILLLGGALLIPAVIAMATHVQGDYFPYGYFIVTGCLSVIGYLRFRKCAAR
jgi:drug/metabolite transporter (DMT)-like permease